MNRVVARSVQSPSAPLERMLAGVLQYGSWVASVAIFAGLALAMIDGRSGSHNLAIVPDMRIVAIGIALFILLPVLRVLIMLIAFLCQRDYRFDAIAALVLAIIGLGYVLGRHMGPAVER
jgi:uncharacterized membrane protein